MELNSLNHELDNQINFYEQMQRDDEKQINYPIVPLLYEFKKASNEKSIDKMLKIIRQITAHFEDCFKWYTWRVEDSGREVEYGLDLQKILFEIVIYNIKH